MTPGSLPAEGGTGAPTAGTGGLNVPIGVHIEKLMEANRDADRRFAYERDRRYSEVAQEREKALKIKETADLAALELAREIQTYKDEKANELRSQIERERGNYATTADLTAMGDKFEALMRPLAEYVTRQQGAGESQGTLRDVRADTRGGRAAIYGAMGASAGIMGVIFGLVALLH